LLFFGEEDGPVKGLNRNEIDRTNTKCYDPDKMRQQVIVGGAAMARWIIPTIAMALFLAVTGLLNWQNISHRNDKTSATEDNSISLVRPAFAQTGSFLDQEAGIAAYVKFQNQIHLESAKQAFKIIEQETSDFVVGTVGIPNSHLAPHAFVSSNGWIVAYFLRDESVGNAWPYGRGFKPPDDVLAKALAKIGATVGAPPPPISYFDFEYPGANRTSVIRAPGTGGLFGVQIPNGFQVFEAVQASNDYDPVRYPGFSEIKDVTPSIQLGQFQQWKGSLILVYREP